MEIMSQMYAKSSILDNLNDICVIYWLKCVTDVDMSVEPAMTNKPATTIVLAWTVILPRASKLSADLQFHSTSYNFTKTNLDYDMN